MKLHKKIFWAWLPSVTYMGLIWVLSSIPMKFSFEIVPFKDKGVHLAEYAVLAILNAFAVFQTWPEFKRRSIFFFACLMTVLWGVLDEVHQATVPGRIACKEDALADVLGAVLGAVIFHYLAPRLLKSRK